MAYATTRLTGAFTRLDGLPARGTVRVDPSVRVLRDPDSNVVLAGRVTVPLDNDGRLDVALPSTDDPGLVEANGAFTYTVTVSLHHAHLPPVVVELPAAVDVFDLADAPISSGVRLITEDDLEAATVGRLVPVPDQPHAYTITTEETPA